MREASVPDQRPVAVTGADGFVGSHLIPALRGAGFPVRAIVRTTAAAARLRTQGCQVALADVRDPTSLDDAFAGCRGAVHLVAVIRERGGATFETVNIQGTANVAAAAHRSGVARLIHFSVLGAGPSAPRYPRSKWSGEEALRAGGVPFVIFRPSFIVGTGGGATAQLADLVRFGPWYPVAQWTGWDTALQRLAGVTPIVPVMGSGTYRSMPVHVGDLMAAVVQALDRDDVLGQVFEIGGPQPVTFDGFLDAIAEVLRLHRWTLHLPLPVARAIVRMTAVLPDPPMTRDELDSLLIDNVCDNTHVTRTFGLTLTPLYAALRRALEKDSPTDGS